MSNFRALACASLLCLASWACSEANSPAASEELASLKIAYEKLMDVSAAKGIDVESLGRPSVERIEGRMVYDFRDVRQNIWVVVIVHDDGRGEVSFTRIHDLTDE